MENQSEDEPLRSRYLYLAKRVIDGENDHNVLKLLQSLQRHCLPDTSFFLERNDFTCWLLSCLLHVRGSSTVINANIELQCGILSLIGSRMAQRLPKYMGAYVDIAAGILQHLKTGNDVQIQCFTSMEDLDSSKIQPLPFSLPSYPFPEKQLDSIIKIFISLAPYVPFHYPLGFQPIYRILVQSMVYGSPEVQSISFAALACFIEEQGLPYAIEDQASVCKITSFCLVRLKEGKFELPLAEGFQANLSRTVSALNKEARHLNLELSQYLIHYMSGILMNPNGLRNFEETLLVSTLSLCSTLSSKYDFILETEELKTNLDYGIEQFLYDSKLMNVYLTTMITNDINRSNQAFQKVYPRKRKIGESIDDRINGADLSFWWKRTEKILDHCTQNLISASNVEEAIRLSRVIERLFDLIASICLGMEPEITVQIRFVKDQSLFSILKYVEQVFIEGSSINLMRECFLVLRSVALASQISDNLLTPNTSNDVGSLCAAVASFPWIHKGSAVIAKNIKSKVFNYSQLSKLVSSASKFQHLDDCTLQKLSIEILALLPKHICSQWRTLIFESLLILQNIEFTRIVMENSLIGMNNILSGTFRQCIKNHALFILKNHHDNEEAISTLSSICSTLFCSMSGSTKIMRKKTDIERLSYECLFCSKDVKDPRSIPQALVDADFLDALLVLVDNPSTLILSQFVESIPQFFNHCKISNKAFNKILSLFYHKNCSITDKFCHSIYTVMMNGDVEMHEKILTHLENLMEPKEPHSTYITGKIQLCCMKVLDHLIRSGPIDFPARLVLIVIKGLLKQHSQLICYGKVLAGELSVALNVSRKMLYLKTQKDAAQVISKALRVKEVAYMLKIITDAFECQDNANGDKAKHWSNIRFLVIQIRYLLPPLVVRAMTEKAPALLKELAHCIKSHVKDMIIDYFPFILYHLVMKCTPNEKNKALRYISSVTEIEIEEIRKCSIQNQVHELVMGLSEREDAVLKEFLIMHSLEGKPIGKTKAHREDQIRDFLSHRVLGIIGFLDGKITSDSSSQRERQCALKSLSVLFEVAGSRHISPVARKILSSLKTALNFSELIPETIQTWKSYLLSLDDSAIENLIEDILLILMPFLKEYSKLLAPTFEKVLLATPSVVPLFNSLPSLPSCEDFSHINNYLKEHKTVSQEISSKTIVVHGQVLLKGLKHDSAEVRGMNLKRLKELLVKNAEIIHQMTSEGEKVHPLISDIFEALLDLCKDNDRELHPLIAECLGHLGAIDPARFSFAKRKSVHEFMFASWDSEKFVLELVKQLSRAFLSAADNTTQISASYALQEILRIYGVNSMGNRSATKIGIAVWKKLSEPVQEILRPLHTSRYVITSSAKQNELLALPVPIYGSKYGRTFHDWLVHWGCSLISTIKMEKPKEVFLACKTILRRDTSTAAQLLPSILKQALMDNPKHHPEILVEILTVINDKPSNRNEAMPKEVSQMATETIFKILDGLSQYIQKERMETGSKNDHKKDKPSLSTTFSIFLSQIPQDQLAYASYKCNSFSRALMQIEAHIKENPAQLRSELNFLQTLYVALDESDGVDGVAAVRGEEPSLEDQIIEYEATGHLHGALGCYEKLSAEGNNQKNIDRMLQCYLNLDQPHAVLNITNGLISKQPEFASSLHEYRVEAAWKLSQWDQLGEYLSEKTASTNTWGVSVGQILHSAIQKDSEKYNMALKDLRTSQVLPIAAALLDGASYHRVYPYLIKLQSLNEIDEVVSGLLKLPKPWSDSVSQSGSEFYGFSGSLSSIDLDRLSDRWTKRLSFVQASIRSLEPVLGFRRILLKLAQDWTSGTNQQLSEKLAEQLQVTWLESAKVARKAKRLEQGERAFLAAGQSRAVFIEKAKWYWLKGEERQAVITLRRGIEKYYPNADKFKGQPYSDNQENRLECARAMLLLANYCEESAIVDSNEVRIIYKEVCDIHKKWEDSHFNIAMYYDRILRSVDENDQPVEWIVHIVLSFGKSLTYGSKHLYHSMPRLLSLWLDFGAKVFDGKVNRKSQNDTTVHEKLSALNTVLGELSDRLPSYMLLTALPQLISRICHSHNEVFAVLGKLIAHLLRKFPQQALWHLIAVSKSSYSRRARRCLSIYSLAKSSSKGLEKTIADFTKLADLFLELSNKAVPKETTITKISTLLRALPRLLADTNFSDILIPLQHLMQVTLPAVSETPTDPDFLMKHDPFPNTKVYISGIEEDVEVMESLQQPKKIVLRGSDGKKYIMMCKPKDDLRKDCRLMEFNSFINRLLLTDAECRKRDLHIRTYAVIPLNDECGLLEWVPNLHGLRRIIHSLYKMKNCYMRGNELKAFLLPKSSEFEKKKAVFVEKLLPRHPPVLREWFLQAFLDPHTWFRARVSYCRTTALMSMAGYVLGLGDRHGENILIDASNGDCVHVDFNCLFNKGETFAWPEKVPFRLTHNMVNAMGPTGVEGMYRRACEESMRVMRTEKEALMSILQPFIHDPLVEWQKDNNAKTTGEIYNSKAQLHVRDIEHRLNGQIRNGRGVNIPLSVEGQINFLIEEATSIANLCQMYIGWGAYM